MRFQRPFFSIWIILACTLAACTPFLLPGKDLETSSPQAGPSPAGQSTMTPSLVVPSPVVKISASPTPKAATPTALSPTVTTAQAPLICSPLEGIQLDELPRPDLLKNPFNPPLLGTDGGHHGADFAFWSWGERKTMLGLPVLSVLAGRVAAVLPLRQPYGNAVIVETRLSDLPPGWLTEIPVPTPAPTVPPAPNLYCPEGSEIEGLTPGDFPETYSLYLLYGHLDKAPDLHTGQALACGEKIGAAGTTGNSVNVHLHLETRLGPSGATFTSLDHYDNAATDLEMSNYCAWRVSGLFQMFDPLHLLSLQP